ncbi:DUF4124 domain-containing protein [Alteromonas portus]|uniref:DUF4124 domain-containing protein n=2 Tax=Alteromonas portus TaxID=2565549 RepID=A0A4U0ZLT3_9ALTE|nr:DUF4124 domain-containing protein [Alteromonas portus]
MQKMTRNFCLISLLSVSCYGLLSPQAAALNQDSERQITLQETQKDSQNNVAPQSASTPTAATSSSKMTIYKVIGKDGVVTYTDKPQRNAEPLAFDGKTQNVVTAPKVSPLPSPKPVAPKPNYRVVIKSPAPEATIRNNLGEITISAAQPGAQKAPIYRLIFDDAPLVSNSSGVFKLSGIHRGAHTYKVELTNNTGKTLASSPVQTLYLHQASALINN